MRGRLRRDRARRGQRREDRRRGQDHRARSGAREARAGGEARRDAHASTRLSETAAERGRRADQGRRPSRDRGGRARRNRRRLAVEGAAPRRHRDDPRHDAARRARSGCRRIDLLVGQEAAGRADGRATASRSTSRGWSISTCAGCSISTRSSPSGCRSSGSTTRSTNCARATPTRSVIVFADERRIDAASSARSRSARRTGSTSTQLDRVDGRQCRGLRRAADLRQIRRRPVEPDLSARHAARAPTCCAASRSANLLPSAHAVDREYRVIAGLHPTGFPVAAALWAVRGRRRDRLGVLRHGDGRGRERCGTARCPTMTPAERTAHLRRDDRHARRAPQHRLRGGGARRLRQARQLFRAPGRRAGPSNIARAETEHMPEVERLIEWLPRTAARADAHRRSSTATTASTT